MRIHFTDKEMTIVKNSIVILVDTREQENKHILEGLDQLKVKHKPKALDFGDYSIMIEKNEKIGIYKDLYFDNEIVIERKNSLTELANNLSNDRSRFEQELIRKDSAKMHLMIEDDSWDKIFSHSYRSEYKPISFIATLHTYISRYNISVNFISKTSAYRFIYFTLLYHLRNRLKGELMDVWPEKEGDNIE